jgi:general secretion pathway protein G
VPSVELGVPPKTNWVRPVLIALSPLLAVGVILFAFAVLVPPTTCCRQTPRARAQADIVLIVCATEEFALNHDGHYPTSLDDLVAPDDQGYRYLNCRTWPLDPWGNRYIYVPPSGSDTEPSVRTLGKDGKIGGTDDAEDIDSRTLFGALVSR